MQLGRFEMFISELRDRCHMAASVVVFLVFRPDSDKWLDEDGHIVSDEAVTTCLNKTIKLRKYWRERSSSTTYFPVKKSDLVVMTISNSPPKKNTREQIDTAINTSFTHAMDAYDASHDGLTGILNAKSIKNALHEAVATSVSSQPEPVNSISDLSIQKQIALISLDIDHFKQVNDSFGHDYGDIVLMCFANRLKQVVLKMEEKHPSSSLSFGRAGGEEFLLIVSGLITEDILKDIAESMRKSIEIDVLPNDLEWKELPFDRAPKALDFPHIADRRITTSIGISSIASPNPKSDTRTICSTLLREADAALYRAKAGGRNVVRDFLSIRQRYGTVLEHHKDTGVVITDIGTHVNVEPGHEFLVYHPDFTGDKPFIHSDGRSRKTLGYYPRHQSGRLVVFDAQKEVSFCNAVELNCINSLPIGSVLEFIPIGSITHLISSEFSGQTADDFRLKTINEFTESIQSNVKLSKPTMVIAFTLLNSKQIESNRGIAYANRSLVNLFKAICDSYPIPAIISQSKPTMFAVQTDPSEEEDIFRIVNQVIIMAQNYCSGLARFGAGICYPQEYNYIGDITKLNPSYLLECATYAASDLVLQDEHIIESFSPNTAHSVVQKLRSRKKYRESISDYEILKKCGVEYADLENLGALCYFESPEPNLDAARKASLRANELVPNTAIYTANLAVIEFAFGSRLEAHKLYSKLHDVDASFDLPEVYWPSRAISAYEQYRTAPDSINATTVLAMLQESRNKKKLANVQITEADIEKAITELATKHV